MTDEHTVGHEMRGVLRQLLTHARTEGRAIEGEVLAFILHAARRIEELAEAIGAEAKTMIHGVQKIRLDDLIKQLYRQVENDEDLKSFWERMAEELPDLIEGIETVIERTIIE